MSKSFSERQISRRDVLRLLGLGGSVVTLGPLVAACGSAAKSGSAPAAAPPAAAPTSTAGTAAVAAPAAAPAASAIQRGGQLVQAKAWTYPSMNMHTTSQPQNSGYHMMFDYLLRYELADEKSGKFALKPGLAESWEQTDPKTVVFHLRKGVKFHDGSDFNADAAKWNLTDLRDNPKSFGKTYLTDVASIDAPDATTLKITLETPSTSLPFRLSGANYGVMGMMSKVAYDKLGEEGFGKAPVGTGPMKFKQWITDDRLILERFDGYWRNGADGKPLPYIDSFVSRYVPDLTVAMADLQSGQLMAAEDMPANQLKVVESNNQLQLVEWPWAGSTYFQMGFNATKAPFDNLKVRQAALYGIDHEAMAKTLGFGFAKPQVYPFWTPSLLGYDDSVEKYPYNPDKVKQLLTEAGYPNGVEIDLLVIQREPEATIGQFAAQMWTKVGIKTTLKAMERLSWINSVRDMNFQSCFWRNAPGQADPSMLTSNIGSKGPNNWSAIKDPEIDGLLAKADQTLDATQRADVYRQVLKRLQDQAYLGEGYLLPMNYVISKKLHGLTAEFGIPDFTGAWLSQ
ncbi:MAG: ABC transporter substrate-binding protein [Chloroflexi bacterium]|nr:ABC transporter substrate-binding protein [Chloroflexota bacterium]